MHARTRMVHTGRQLHVTGPSLDMLTDTLPFNDVVCVNASGTLAWIKPHPYGEPFHDECEVFLQLNISDAGIWTDSEVPVIWKAHRKLNATCTNTEVTTRTQEQ